jgi:signal transduction histidine kinase
MTSEIGPVYFLLVDDLEENLLSLESLLRRDGLVLIKARSGTEALELLLQYDVALAILDVQMPEMDGYELAELMRGTERTRRVPIIFLTAGTADRQRRFRGYETGAVDFLIKPIEPDILRSKAAVFFELYQQRHQIAAQRDELKAYAGALMEADRRKDEFLATLAHELRNPLAPIRNGLDILRASPMAPNAEEIREVMDRQLSHLVRLVDDLLDVSRVRQGKIELRREQIALSDILKTAVEASNPLITAGRHELLLDLPDAPVWLDADLTRLSQVVSNLLNNAAKYTPEGGKIVLLARRDRDEVLITVSDNGVGIPSAMLPQVFDLFTQVRDNLHRSHGGLGIGLALVKQLVEMHDGAIAAESAGPGKGSAFRLRLPVAESAPAASGAAPKPPSRVSQQEATLKVLVVDDNFDVAQIMGWMLETIGHDYRLVHESKLAVQTAQEYRPDAILLDINMPGMDGYAVCRALREQTLFDDTVIIAQTGWGQAQDHAGAGESGFDHHLVKPVNMDRLEQVLAGILSARQHSHVGDAGRSSGRLRRGAAPAARVD